MYEDIYCPIVCVHCIGQFIPDQHVIAGIANNVRIPPEILSTQPIAIGFTSIISMQYLQEGGYPPTPKYQIKNILFIGDIFLADTPVGEHEFTSNTDIRGCVSMLPVDVRSTSPFIFPHEYHIDLYGKWEDELSFKCLARFNFTMDREQVHILEIPDPQKTVQEVMKSKRNGGLRAIK